MADQPYNSLGQILAKGGEIALGLALSGGWSEDRVRALFLRRFEPMTDADRGSLYEFAGRGVRAGELANSTAPEDQLPLSDIPINAALFDEDGGGNRVLVVVDYSFDGGATSFQVRLPFPDVPTAAEIAKAVGIEADELRERYPTMRGVAGTGDNPEVTINYKFMERSF